MDVGLGRVSPVSGAQFACFRVVFGVYLAIHFAALVPYGPELFGSAGLVPDPVQNFTHGILPNPLEHPVSDAWIQGFLVALVGLSLAFAVGFQRRMNHSGGFAATRRSTDPGSPLGITAANSSSAPT